MDNTNRTISIRDLDALLDALLGVLTSVKTALFHHTALRVDDLDTEQKRILANKAFGSKSGAQMADVGSVSIPASICHPLDFLFGNDMMSAQSVLLTPVHVGMPWSSEPYEGFRIATWTDGDAFEHTDILSRETVRQTGDDVFTFVGVLPASMTDIPGITVDQQVRALKALVSETCHVAGIDRRTNAPMDDESMTALEAEIARDLGNA